MMNPQKKVLSSKIEDSSSELFPVHRAASSDDDSKRKDLTQLLAAESSTSSVRYNNPVESSTGVLVSSSSTGGSDGTSTHHDHIPAESSFVGSINMTAEDNTHPDAGRATREPFTELDQLEEFDRISAERESVAGFLPSCRFSTGLLDDTPTHLPVVEGLEKSNSRSGLLISGPVSVTNTWSSHHQNCTIGEPAVAVTNNGASHHQEMWQTAAAASKTISPRAAARSLSASWVPHVDAATAASLRWTRAENIICEDSSRKTFGQEPGNILVGQDPQDPQDPGGKTSSEEVVAHNRLGRFSDLSAAKQPRHRDHRSGGGVVSFADSALRNTAGSGMFSAGGISALWKKHAEDLPEKGRFHATPTVFHGDGLPQNKIKSSTKSRMMDEKTFLDRRREDYSSSASCTTTTSTFSSRRRAGSSSAPTSGVAMMCDHHASCPKSSSNSAGRTEGGAFRSPSRGFAGEPEGGALDALLHLTDRLFAHRCTESDGAGASNFIDATKKPSLISSAGDGAGRRSGPVVHYYDVAAFERSLAEQKNSSSKVSSTCGLFDAGSSSASVLTPPSELPVRFPSLPLHNPLLDKPLATVLSVSLARSSSSASSATEDARGLGRSSSSSSSAAFSTGNTRGKSVAELLLACLVDTTGSTSDEEELELVSSSRRRRNSFDSTFSKRDHEVLPAHRRIISGSCSEKISERIILEESPPLKESPSVPRKLALAARAPAVRAALTGPRESGRPRSASLPTSAHAAALLIAGRSKYFLLSPGASSSSSSAVEELSSSRKPHSGSTPKLETWRRSASRSCPPPARSSHDLVLHQLEKCAEEEEEEVEEAAETTHSGVRGTIRGVVRVRNNSNHSRKPEGDRDFATCDDQSISRGSHPPPRERTNTSKRGHNNFNTSGTGSAGGEDSAGEDTFLYPTTGETFCRRNFSSRRRSRRRCSDSCIAGRRAIASVPPRHSRELQSVTQQLAE